jgi:hypothetical protein
MKTLWRSAMAISLALVIALGIFYPSLVTKIWHLRYPNGVHYAGRDILVPLEWTADENGLTVRLTKYPATVFDKIPQGRIFLTPATRENLLAVEKDSDRQWESEFRKMHAGQGIVIQGPARFILEGKESVCMKSSSEKNPARISAECGLFGGEWRMEFSGDVKDLDLFLENFHHMNRN